MFEEKKINLTPYYENSVEVLEKKFKKEKLRYDVDGFISMFNMKILSSANPVVKEIATLITRTYKNVDLFNNQLIIKNDSEIAVENIIYLVEQWKLVSALKRISEELLTLDYDYDTRIYFLVDKPGIPHVKQEVLTEDEIIFEYAKVPGIEKVVSKNEDVVKNLIIGRYMNIEEDENGENNICSIKIEDVIDIDDAFILDVERIVKENTLRKDYE